jgi:hypothetical protein
MNVNKTKGLRIGIDESYSQLSNCNNIVLTASPGGSCEDLAGRPDRYFILGLYFSVVRGSAFQHVHRVCCYFWR